MDHFSDAPRSTATTPPGQGGGEVEQVLFQGGDVLVTTRRFVSGPRTVPISMVASVRKETGTKLRDALFLLCFPAVIAAAVGAAFLYGHAIAFPITLLVGGVLIFVARSRMPPRFDVVVTAASGQEIAVACQSAADMDYLVRVLVEATTTTARRA